MALDQPDRIVLVALLAMLRDVSGLLGDPGAARDRGDFCQMDDGDSVPMKKRTGGGVAARCLRLITGGPFDQLLGDPVTR